jgi:hypothetical protein
LKASFEAFKHFRENLPPDLNPPTRRDLIADHLTQEGYIYLDFATERFSIDSSPNFEHLLEKAAQDFTAALDIKPNWNPAQVYLALTRLIQSGLAAAHIDFLQYKKAIDSQHTPKPDNPQAGGENAAAAKQHGRKDSQAEQTAPAVAATDPAPLSYPDRQLEKWQEQKEFFSRKAADLFAALEGDSCPQPASSSPQAKKKEDEPAKPQKQETGQTSLLLRK